MKILHSSDWHLGATLGRFKRTAEFKALLNWLLRVLTERKIEALIISGDIFDSSIPSNGAAELYYRFLADARNTGVRHIIAVAGNHDSASFLEAPKSVLRALNCKVVGKADNANCDEEILPLRNAEGQVEAVVCAVPYLRDRDIRSALSGEDARQQQESRCSGILRHYRAVCSRAAELYPGIPLIATGHFYAAGGKVSGENSVGNLSGIAISELPQNIDYLAMGHLHIPQCVAGKQNCRYPGSLLQLNFSDRNTEKKVLILDTARLAAPPQEIEVPVFQKMEQITGEIEPLRARIEELRTRQESVWLRIENTGEFEPQLPQLLASFCEDSPLQILSCHNRKPNPMLRRRDSLGGKKLDELTPEMVFRSLLDESGGAPERKAALLRAFREAETELAESDVKAE